MPGHGSKSDVNTGTDMYTRCKTFNPRDKKNPLFLVVQARPEQAQGSAWSGGVQRLRLLTLSFPYLI
jgi:hypothetical protein